MKRKMIGCFVAVATSMLVFGAMSLNVASANADGNVIVNETASFEMTNGAAVRLNDPMDGQSLSGIRWQATLNDYYYYNTLNLTDSDEVEFGALVGPASRVGENVFDNTTMETTEAIFVPCKATKPTFDENGNFSYYASITYNELEESLKQEAYTVELVARAYVKVGDTYNFVDTYETTRSMRAIALAAVQSGKYEESELNTYYNQKQPTVSVTESGYYETTKVAEASNVLTNVNNLAVGANYSAYVGAQPVAVNVTENGVGIVSAIPFSDKKLGDELKLNVFDADGNIYTQEFTYATKVFYEASDLSISNWSYFSAQNTAAIERGEFKKITVGTNTGYVVDGVYYLGKDINMNGARMDSTTTVFCGADYENIHAEEFINVGFVGTFDGKGHTISNMKVGSLGIFNVIGGGAQIKNFALEDVVYASTRKKASIFAGVIVGTEESYASFENISISIASQTDYKWYYSPEDISSPVANEDGTAILAFAGSVYTHTNNLVVDVSAVGDINVLGRGLFNFAYNGDNTVNKIGQYMTNTFVVSSAPIIYSRYNTSKTQAYVMEGANKSAWSTENAYNFAAIAQKKMLTELKVSYVTLSESLYRFADPGEMTDYIKANTACVDSFNNAYWTVDAENGSLVWGKTA